MGELLVQTKRRRIVAQPTDVGEAISIVVSLTETRKKVDHQSTFVVKARLPLPQEYERHKKTTKVARVEA